MLIFFIRIDMKGRGRGIRGRKLEKPRPLRSQSDGGAPFTEPVTNQQEPSSTAEASRPVAARSVPVRVIPAIFKLEEMLININEIQEDLFLACIDDIIDAGKFMDTESLDKLYSVIRNSLVDDGLHPRWRAPLLQLLELRASSWTMDSLTSEYYHNKVKEALNYKNKLGASHNENAEERTEESSIFVTRIENGILCLSVKRRFAEVFTTPKAHGMIAMVTDTSIRNVYEGEEWLKFEIRGNDKNCSHALQMFMERIEDTVKELACLGKEPPAVQRRVGNKGRCPHAATKSQNKKWGKHLSGAPDKVPASAPSISRRSSEPAYLGSASIPRLPTKPMTNVASTGAIGTTTSRARGRGRGRGISLASSTSPASPTDISPRFLYTKTHQDSESSDGRFDNAEETPKFKRSISSPEDRNISKDKQFMLDVPSLRSNGTTSTSTKKLLNTAQTVRSASSKGNDSMLLTPNFLKADLNQNVLRQDSATALMLGKNPSLPVVKASDLDDEVEFWGDEEESQLERELANSIDSKTSDESLSKNNLSGSVSGQGDFVKKTGFGVPVRCGFGNVTSTPAVRQHRKSLGDVDSFSANLSAIAPATKNTSDKSSLMNSKAYDELNEAFDRSSIWSSLRANRTTDDSESGHRGRNLQRSESQPVRSRSLGRSLSGGNQTFRSMTGFIQPLNILREPIHPLTDRLELIMIEREMPGGDKSAKERRRLFQWTSEMQKNKQPTTTKAFGTVLQYSRDTLLAYSTFPLSRQPPQQLKRLWDHFPELIIVKNNKPFDPAAYTFNPPQGKSCIKSSNLNRLPSFESHKMSDIVTQMTGANDRLIQ